MENLNYFRSYFSIKLRNKFAENKKTPYINLKRLEQVKRINKKTFDYIIYGIDINVIALAKNLLKDGKSCLLVTENDLVDYQPNLISSYPLSISLIYILVRRYFKKEESHIIQEYFKIYNENLIKLFPIDSTINQPIKIDLSHLLFYQKIYLIILNNLLMYKIDFKHSFLNISFNKVYSNQPCREINSTIMAEITNMSIENRNRFKVLNHCKLNAIEDSSDNQKVVNFTDSINQSSFKVLSNNVVVYRSLFNNTKFFKRKMTKIDTALLGISNEANSVMVNHVSNGYYINEFLKLNSEILNESKTSISPFIIDSQNFEKYIEIYKKKFYKTCQSSSSFSFKQVVKSNYIYLRMKFGELNNVIEKQILKIILLNESFKVDFKENPDVELKLTSFINIWSNNLTLTNFIKILKLSNENFTIPIKASKLQTSIDNANIIYHNIDKDVINKLFKTHGNYAEFILKTGDKIKKNVIIGKKQKILVSQIIFEINFLHLNSPIEFLFKRHNYYKFFRENEFMEISKILTVFANENNYNCEKYQLEYIKLLAFKYLLTKYTIN